jgi:hypothetical protein
MQKAAVARGSTKSSFQALFQCRGRRQIRNQPQCFFSIA